MIASVVERRLAWRGERPEGVGLAMRGWVVPVSGKKRECSAVMLQR